jgi:hypothetical protein
MVSYGAEAFDCWFLHCDSQESGKYSFHRSSLIVEVFEPLGAIVDFLPNTGAQSNEDVTAFLLEELRVASRTKEVLATKFFGPM